MILLTFLSSITVNIKEERKSIHTSRKFQTTALIKEDKILRAIRLIIIFHIWQFVLKYQTQQIEVKNNPFKNKAWSFLCLYSTTSSSKLKKSFWELVEFLVSFLMIIYACAWPGRPDEHTFSFLFYILDTKTKGKEKKVTRSK